MLSTEKSSSLQAKIHPRAYIFGMHPFHKYVLLLLIFLGVFTSGKAQHNFLDVSQWHVSEIGPGFAEFPWYEAVSDTTINGLTYKTVLVDGQSTGEYVREDGPNRQVFITGSAWGWQETLLYDFGIALGDSLNLTLPGYPPSLYVVDSIGMVNSNQGFLNLWKLSKASLIGGPPQNMYWIDGLGDRNHPFYPLRLPQTDNSYKVICSFKNAIKFYDDGFGTCPNLPPPLSRSIPAVFAGLSVYPNPGSEFVNIRLPFAAGKTKLDIIDLNNRRLATYILDEREQQISLLGLPNGICVFRFSSENAKFHAQTVIIR